VAKALAAAKPNEWLALQTKDGWRAMQLSAAYPAKPADFATVQNVVRQDWTDGAASEQRSAAVAALTKKYTIKYETAAHGSSE
jgi:hypothetical protein